MQLRGKAAVCAAIVLAACGCGWLLFRDAPPPVATEVPTHESGPPPAASTPVSADAIPPAMSVGDSTGIHMPVATACAGEPWEAQPGDPCARAMDHRFFGEPVSPVPLFHGHGGWHPDDDGQVLAAARRRGESDPPPMPTWREVFEDAREGRALAEAALANPACSEGGDGAGRAACAADAVAAAGLLQEACIKPLAADGLRNPWSPPGDVPHGFFGSAEKTEIWRMDIDQLDADPDLTPEEYWKLRQHAEDAMYRYAWRMMRCAALPEAALTWFDGLPTPTGEVWDDNQSKALYGFAARHGVEWAEARLRLRAVLCEGSVYC